jgi:hypothetical protein
MGFGGIRRGDEGIRLRIRPIGLLVKNSCGWGWLFWGIRNDNRVGLHFSFFQNQKYPDSH